MRGLTYKETDNNIELMIFGLKFKINEKETEKIMSKKQEEIEKEAEENENYIVELIDKILGDGSADKINEQRSKDGYEPMNIKVQMQVFSFICEEYARIILNPVNRTTNRINGYKNNRNRYNKFNNKYRR